MAIVKCKECGSDVSTEAKACPHCGAGPADRTAVMKLFLKIVVACGFGIAAYIVLAVAFMMTGGSTPGPVLTVFALLVGAAAGWYRVK